MELTQHLQMEIKLVLLAHNLAYICTNIITQIHLGIVTLVHHNHGSRSLIDTVHSDGNCVSYDELRRFLTSSAENDLHHVQSGIYMTYIPNSISLL